MMLRFRSSPFARLSSLLALVFAGSASFAGCETQIGQCEALPSCGSDIEVDECPQGASCYESELCGQTILCQRAENCLAYPVCDDGDVEVDACPDDATCYEASICGVTIVCMETDQCAALPSCDPGDEEVATCPDDASCYDATLCGMTITCHDAAYPQHGCPHQEPTFGEACDPRATPAECHYPPCSFYACEDMNGTYAWTTFGGCPT